MKALFFDIDGTLLSEITKEIPQSALDALKKTAEKGNLTFINTGRTWSELPEELKKLPFSGFLCGCGTYLRRDGEILMHQTIPKKRCEEIPVILKECRIGMILEGTDNVYFPSEVSRFQEVEQTRAHFAAVGIGLAETAEETEEIIRQVRAEIEFADEQSDIPISVAMGYAWTDAEEKNLPELIHCADEKMYKDKKRIKENTSSA